MSGVSDLTGALRVRQRSATRRRIRRIVEIFGVLFLVAGLVWFIVFSPVFVVRHVRVEGNRLVTAARVIEAAEVPMGRQLARVDTAAIAERVQVLPVVQQAEVSRGWPNAVRVRITERQRVYQRQEAAGFSWVDADGVIFHTQHERVPAVVVGQTPEADPRLLRDVATVVAAMPAELAQRVQAVVASSVDLIVLQLDNDQQVIWGSAAQSDLKGQVVVPLLKQQGRVFDVSAPSHPTLR